MRAMQRCPSVVIFANGPVTVPEMQFGATREMADKGYIVAKARSP